MAGASYRPFAFDLHLCAFDQYTTAVVLYVRRQSRFTMWNTLARALLPWRLLGSHWGPPYRRAWIACYPFNIVPCTGRFLG